jgi:uncharacterized protein
LDLKWSGVRAARGWILTHNGSVMLATAFLFGGGLLFWVGLCAGRRRRGWPRADFMAVLGASVLFGGVHLGGGIEFALLATLAGLGYGTVYYWTGRLHYAVLLHFAVNAVHLLAFAAPAV